MIALRLHITKVTKVFSKHLLHVGPGGKELHGIVLAFSDPKVLRSWSKQFLLATSPGAQSVSAWNSSPTTLKKTSFQQHLQKTFLSCRNSHGREGIKKSKSLSLQKGSFPWRQSVRTCTKKHSKGGSGHP